MTCACEQDERGHVIGLCGAHSRFERERRPVVNREELPTYVVWFVDRTYAVQWIKRDGSLVCTTEMKLR